MYYFIVNPKSSSGKGLKIWKELESKLSSVQIEYQTLYTTGDGDATRIARELCLKSVPCTIVAVGGDGTADEVVNGLEPTEGVTFAYLPTGSGNDLARGLGLSKDPSVVLDSIINPTIVRQINIGEITAAGEKRRFLVSCGIGYDAAICHEAFRSPMKKLLNKFNLGKLTYVAIALKQLLFLKPSSFTVILDDNPPIRFRKAFFISVMNMKYEGGGFMFCPKADPEDGYLDLCIAKQMPKFSVLWMLPKSLKGHHTKSTRIQILKGHHIHIKTSAPLAVHSDGEAFGCQTEMTVALLKKPLPFIVG